jgi:N6-adenosine-specific RNA methylase IME4
VIDTLPDEKYSVVLADPPWQHYGSPAKYAAAGKFYDLMPDLDMLAFPMGKLMEKPGVLFLWATGPRLDFAVKCIEWWGLHYRGVAFCWVKTKKNGKPIGAQGVRPSVVKPLTELCLVASTEKRGRPLPLGSESVVQTVFAPRREHSRKPDEVIERIDALYPGILKLELFGRGRPANHLWDIWGDEAETA